ncbi:ArpU family phage packaging/lysis transcriptional regulator [Enterococcus avium]|uniref:ArpU family phage packaging/lysis transcriptional regulator n=1 Tax=Enterococcus avium TaxID=33945 RepID=UPI0028913A1F|nr:ArpU family phage packaging/lysis transcriptional regulator [Enterococcus avium]MDT2427178.1 ArpU family phage packaging/lysis transcriptional regulator [Enterococcus avium]
MIELLNEIDKKASRKNAKKVLNKYRVLEKIAGRKITLQGVEISDMPKGQASHDTLENQIIKRIDAENECLNILEAIDQLADRERKTLKLAFISSNPCTTLQMAYELQYSERSIERIKSNALIQFAYAYKNGELLVWR